MKSQALLDKVEQCDSGGESQLEATGSLINRALRPRLSPNSASNDVFARPLFD